jgi:hypothetical protein
MVLSKPDVLIFEAEIWQMKQNVSSRKPAITRTKKADRPEIRGTDSIYPDDIKLTPNYNIIGDVLNIEMAYLLHRYSDA